MAEASNQFFETGRERFARAHWILNTNVESIDRAQAVIRGLFGSASALNELSSERFLRAAGEYPGHETRLLAYRTMAQGIATDLRALEDQFELLVAQHDPNATLGFHEAELDEIDARNLALETQLDDEFNMTIDSLRKDYNASIASRFDECECGCMDSPLKVLNLDAAVAAFTQPVTADAQESFQRENEIDRRVDYIYSIINPVNETASPPRVRYPRGNARLEFPSAYRLQLYKPRFRTSNGAERLIQRVIDIRRYVFAILRARNPEAKFDSLREPLGAAVTELLSLILEIHNGAYTCRRLSLAFSMLHSAMLDVNSAIVTVASECRATATWSHFLQHATPMLVQQAGCLQPLHEYARRYDMNTPRRISMRQLQQRGHSARSSRNLIRAQQNAERSSHRVRTFLANWGIVFQWGVSIIHGLDVFFALLEMGAHELRAYDHASMEQRCLWRTRYEHYISVVAANPPRIAPDSSFRRTRTALAQLRQGTSSESD